MDEKDSRGGHAPTSTEPPTREKGAAPLELELDQSGDEWLEHLREAERPVALGSMGPYELIEEIGRGGQGIVYRARQPNTKRIIAIKRLVAGAYATPEAQVRFKREIEAEAALSHPSIVGVYGLDVVDGQPVLAMEWIDGEPVNRWAAGNGHAPDRQEILGTFLKICDAVRHAHQRGVIHRDLKPSNILVDETGKPHVLDFGLAKIANAEDAEATRLTRTREFVGTPVYAAPEQLRGEVHGVDVRSDVYALGVVLYEMLTGRTPYPPDASVLELVEAMRRSEPTPLSSHDRSLDGEIDAIVGKALAGEQERRYQSVDALGLDLRRYLAGDPIEAKGHTFGYVLRKQVKKYRVPAAIAAGVAVLLTVAMVISLAGWRSAERQRGVAERERGIAENKRAEAEAVTDLVQEMLSSADPHSGQPRDLTVRQLLDGFSASLGDSLRDQPEVEATLHLTIGSAYLGLGLPDSAEGHLQSALALREREYGLNDPLTAQAMGVWAGLLSQNRARYAEARSVLEEAVAIVRATTGDDHRHVAAMLTKLSDLHLELGDWQAAEEAALAALGIRQRLFGEEHASVATSLAMVAHVLRKKGEYRQALTRCEKALAMRRRIFGNTHLVVVNSLGDLAGLRRELGDYEGAEQLDREALKMRRELLGDEHPHVASAMQKLAVSLWSLGRSREAASLLLEALEINRRVYGEAHPVVAYNLSNLASQYQAEGRLDEAEELHREALEMRRDTFEDDDPRIAESLGELATVLWAQGRSEEAEPLLRDALGIYRATLGEGPHPDVALTLFNLAAQLEAQGELDEAARHYRKGLDMDRLLRGDDHPIIAKYLNNLASLELKAGDFATAEQLLREALAIARRSLPAGHPDTVLKLQNLAWLLYRNGKLNEAESMAREAIETYRGSEAPDPGRYVLAFRHLVEILRDQDRFEDVETALRESLDMLERDLPAQDERIAFHLALLAGALVAQGKFDEGEQLARDARARFSARFGDRDPRTAAASRIVGEGLTGQAAFAEAEEILRECVRTLQSLTGGDPVHIAKAESALGECLAACGRFEEAEALLLQSHDTMRAARDENFYSVRIARRRIVGLYEAWSKPDKAREWRQELAVAGEEP